MRGGLARGRYAKLRSRGKIQPTSLDTLLEESLVEPINTEPKLIPEEKTTTENDMICECCKTMKSLKREKSEMKLVSDKLKLENSKLTTEMEKTEKEKSEMKKAFKYEVDKLQAQISGLKRTIQQKDQDITNLKSNVDDKNSLLKSIQRNIENLNGKNKYRFDSLSNLILVDECNSGDSGFDDDYSRCVVARNVLISDMTFLHNLQRLTNCTDIKTGHANVS